MLYKNSTTRRRTDIGGDTTEADSHVLGCVRGQKTEALVASGGRWFVPRVPRFSGFASLKTPGGLASGR